MPLKHNLRLGLIVIIALIVFAKIGYSAETINYRYDDMDRLTRVEYGSGTVVEYAYDKMGNSLQKRVTAPDITSPAILSTNPANGATGVPVNTSVSATFSEPMNPATINTTTFTVSGITGRVDYTGTTAVFNPSVNLAPSTTYTATITSAVTDTSGKAMASNYTWRFTTGGASDSSTPTVISTRPVNGATNVAITAPISATFSESMDATTINNSTFFLSGGGTGTVSYDNTTKTATLKPSSELKSSTTYTATITTGVNDLSGNALSAAYLWVFTTTTGPDITKPTVISTTPAHGGTYYPCVNEVPSAIAARFSETMDASTIGTSTFIINGGTGTVSYDNTTRTATFTPIYPSLRNAGTYTATIDHCVMDTAGNRMAADYVWSFTTRGCGEPIPIGLDKTISGSLGPCDCESLYRSGCYADRYSFSALSGSLISVEMTPLSSFNTYLYLIGPSGSIVAYNDNSGTGSRIPPDVGWYELPSTGTYTLEATSYNAGAAGTYTVSLKSIASDKTPPAITSTNPANGATGVPVTTTTLSATFNDVMDASTIGASTFYLSGGITGTVSLSGDKRTATLTLSRNLDYSTTYTATITRGVKDQAGNNMVSNYTWSFTTPCIYSILPTTATFPVSGGTSIVGVTAGSCAWTAASNAAWIIITSGSSGTGNGTVGYSVAAYTGASYRTGTMTIAGQTFTVTQSGTCTYTLSPTSATSPAVGGSGSVGVTAGSGCDWTAASNAAWIAITSGGSGTGTGTVGYSVAANTGTSQRAGAMTIAGKPFTVTQSGVTAQTLGDAVDNTSLSWTSGGDANWFGQAVSSYYGGDAAQGGDINDSQSSWVQTTVTSATGGTLSFYWKVSSEYYDYLRFYIDGVEQTGSISGTVDWQPKTFSIASGSHTLKWAYTKNTYYSSGSDAGWLDKVVFSPNCSYILSPTSATSPAAGGSSTVGVTAGSGCAWTAASNAAWITITSGSGGTGNGTVSYSVAAYTGTSYRTGTMTIAGQTFTVTQSGTCTYTLSPTSATSPAVGGNGSVGVTAGSGCAWAAASNTAWIAITSGSSGTGTGTVGYSVAANTGTSQRAGAMTIAGKPFTVTQSGVTAQTLGDVVDNTSLSWTTGGDANWFGQLVFSYDGGDAAQSGDINDSQSSWVQTTVTSATGGTLTFYWKVSSQSGYDYLRFYIDGVEQAGRISGTVDWQQKTFTVASGTHTLKWAYTKNSSTSSGSDAGWLDKVVFSPNCTYTLSPFFAVFQDVGGSNSVGVTAGSGCSWTAVSNAAWITITSGSGGTGNGTVSYSVAAYTGTITSYRTGTMTIAGQPFIVMQSGACTYTLSPTSATSPAVGGNGSVGVTAVSGCAWTAASNAAWITITSGSSGTGNGTVGYSVAAYTGASYRTGAMTIAGQPFTVTQSGTCTYTLSPTSATSPAVGGNGSVGVTAGSDCAWMAASNAVWITITSGSSGAGTGTVEYSVAANTGTSQRAGAMTIAGKTFTVTQSGVTAQTLGDAVDNTSLSWTSGGYANWFGQLVSFYDGGDAAQSGAVYHSQSSWVQTTVTSTAGGTLTFYWKVSSSVNDYLRFYIDGVEQTGRISGTVDWQQKTFTVASGTHTLKWAYIKDSYYSSGSDTGWLDKVVFSPNCSYILSATSATSPAAGGSSSVGVTAGSGCAWTAASNAAWITITSGSNGTGNGTVGYSVAAYTGASYRTGTMTIAGQTFTVTQSGTCTYTLSPTSATYPYTAGTGTVGVTAGSGCSWTAASNAAWIAITSGSSGTGTGTVGYSVAANTDASQRAGTMTIAGKPFTVTQAVAPCTYTLSATSATYSAGGGSGSVGVTAGSGCAWMAVSNVPWITITSGSSGTGTGTLGYSVAAHTNRSQRTGTMTIAGKTFTVTQAGVCTYTLSATSATYPYPAGTGTVGVTAGSGCAWTAVSNAAWITITSGSSLTGTGTVGYSVAAYTGASYRTGTMTIAGQTFTVTQSGTCTYTLSPTSATSPAAGSSRSSVGVTAGIDCAWTAASNTAWITISSGSSGTGTGTVGYSVAANTGTSQRTGAMTIAGRAFMVTQSGVTANTLGDAVDNTSLSWTSGGDANWFGQAVSSYYGGDAAQGGDINDSQSSWVQTTVTSDAGGTLTFCWKVSSESGYDYLRFYIDEVEQAGSISGTVGWRQKTFPVASGTHTLKWAYTKDSSESIDSDAGWLDKVVFSPNCSYILSPTSATSPAVGGTGSVGVTAGSGCIWTAASNAAWITITSGSSGTGNGTVGYSVVAYTGTSYRTGAITIAGQTFTVTQSGACTYTLSPTSATYPYTAGIGTVGVAAGSGCAWAAASNVPWITITSGSSGTGTGTVGYSVAANTSGSQRAGTTNIAGKAFTITQAGAPCTYTLSPTSATYPYTAGTGTVGVAAGSGCAWTVVNNVTWITITSGSSGTGNGTVGYLVAANNSASQRAGTITIAGKTFTITQAGASCTYTLSPTSATSPAVGGGGSVGVTAGSGCAWTVASNAAWITITSGSSGTGNGTVAYSVAANTGTSYRTGTITIAGQAFTVTQSGSCTYTISATSATYTATAGTGRVGVTAGSGCAWTAVSNATAWLTITSGRSGTGNGMVGYSVTANTGASYRTGTMTIAGWTFTVTQSGACTYTLSATSATSPAVGGSGSVGVTAGSGCAWTAVSNAAWITITSGSSLTGTGTVGYSVAANTGASYRTGTITIAGQTFTVTQSGSCTYTLSAVSAISPAVGSSGTVGVTAGSGCGWTAVSNVAWINITSGSNGTGTGTVGYSVDANTGQSQRIGAMTIAGQTFTVTQVGITLGAAVDNTSLSWTTGGDANWFVQADSYYGGSAAQSGDITDGQSSWAQTTVTGPAAGGTLTFYWKVSSELNDYLRFYIDGVEQAGSISGTVDWQQKTFTVASGIHTLKWAYTKNSSTSIGSDAGWLDKVVFGPTCAYTLSATRATSPAVGGSGSVGVAAGSGCTWTAASNAVWITITSGSSGTGNGTVGYSVAAYTGTIYRTGTITIAGQTFTVTQSGACTYTLSATSATSPIAGGSGSVGVTAGSGCGWTAASNVAWITITSGSSGLGNGTVGYSVAVYTGTIYRTGTMTIAGQTFTVTQSGTCTYTLSATSATSPAAGGSSSVGVTAGSGCSWTAASNATWITITSGSSGTGNGTVGYSVAAYTGASYRTGAMTIAGQTFTVTQSGTCTYTLSPTSATYPYTAGTGTVGVTAGSGCAWTAASNAAWIAISSGSSGTGTGTVGYSVAANTGSSQRAGTMTIAGKTFAVTQSGFTIGDAVDNTSLSWTTGGDANWFAQADSYYGGSAAQSGDITDYQSSWVQTTVTSLGGGTLTFYWKVSSESGYDYLRFYIDGVEQAVSISGTVDWQQKTFSIASGNHTLKWVYTKDDDYSAGLDAGWLDKVVFSPN